MLRETLFNVLAPRVCAARWTASREPEGWIEALSRGAAHVTSSNATPGASTDRGEPGALRIAEGYAIRASLIAGSKRCDRPRFAPFDIVLLDPPYDQAADTCWRR
jgi:16S rRNA G966 N2-methylase RsmD